MLFSPSRLSMHPTLVPTQSVSRCLTRIQVTMNERRSKSFLAANHGVVDHFIHFASVVLALGNATFVAPAYNLAFPSVSVFASASAFIKPSDFQSFLISVGFFSNRMTSIRWARRSSTMAALPSSPRRRLIPSVVACASATRVCPVLTLVAPTSRHSRPAIHTCRQRAPRLHSPAL